MVVFSEHDKYSLLSSYFIVSQSAAPLNYHLCIQRFRSFIDKPLGTVHSIGGISSLFHCLWKVHEIRLTLSEREAEREKKRRFMGIAWSSLSMLVSHSSECLCSGSLIRVVAAFPN